MTRLSGRAAHRGLIDYQCIIFRGSLILQELKQMTATEQRWNWIFLCVSERPLNHISEKAESDAKAYACKDRFAPEAPNDPGKSGKPHNHDDGYRDQNAGTESESPERALERAPERFIKPRIVRFPTRHLYRMPTESRTPLGVFAKTGGYFRGPHFGFVSFVASDCRQGHTSCIGVPHL